MIVRQFEQGILMLGKMDNVMEMLEKAIKAGYRNLPAVWSLKLYLQRN